MFFPLKPASTEDLQSQLRHWTHLVPKTTAQAGAKAKHIRKLSGLIERRLQTNIQSYQCAGSL